MVYIKTSGQTSDGQWIVSEGIKTGDRIITSGLQSVIPGKAVRILNSNQPPLENKNKINIFQQGIEKIKSIFN